MVPAGGTSIIFVRLSKGGEMDMKMLPVVVIPRYNIVCRAFGGCD